MISFDLKTKPRNRKVRPRMNEADKAKGIVVKNRNDQYSIIPAEVFEQYRVPQEALGKIETFYDSDVEGQGVDFSWSPNWSSNELASAGFSSATDRQQVETFAVFKIVF